jgi:endonuclease/exonuclease/phosphatase (EEP) superfamily protein YafD
MIITNYKRKTKNNLVGDTKSVDLKMKKTNLTQTVSYKFNPERCYVFSVALVHNKCSVTSVETHPLINESKVDFVISYSIASSFFEMLLSNGSINFRISFVDALVEKIRKQLDEIMENTIKNYGAKNEI